MKRGSYRHQPQALSGSATLISLYRSCTEEEPIVKRCIFSGEIRRLDYQMVAFETHYDR